MSELVFAVRNDELASGYKRSGADTLSMAAFRSIHFTLVSESSVSSTMPPSPIPTSQSSQLRFVALTEDGVTLDDLPHP
ncbi:hypothetical protein D9613_012827 [Agrocybe pediades]|uniref:Uncharacterized protein n=1 Tax=Agrocybe pediades TaxID=84607 RepID=A0A8H4R2I4_9AGAR|nr:hypothetical protein D9613_012827 [Agrocybe pediades]